MALIVQKYGGTSVGTLARIREVSARALETQRMGNQVVLIVSAMAGETNRLLGLADQIGAQLPDRELDVLASTGEQVSAALTAMTIHHLGGSARSLLGHQVKVHTDGAFTKARIRMIDDASLRNTVGAGQIAVVAGFQGMDSLGNVTTLGRGGSDTTAVAIAAAIGADVCEIYTDVEGVFTTDPNVCASARRIEQISFEEMLELSSLGAKVLQIRSVEVAMKYGIPIHVRSSFSDRTGTMVSDDAGLESLVVRGVAYDKNEARVQLVAMPDKPGTVAEVFALLARANVPIDMIIQSAAHGDSGSTDVTFTVAKRDLSVVREILDAHVEEIGGKGVEYSTDIAKISIVGLAVRNAGVAAKMFQILAAAGVNIHAICSSEIRVSCIISDEFTERAVQALHDGFALQTQGRTIAPPPM